MNELYAADPSACKHSSDLQLLLRSFGPFTGRYLANYPSDWTSKVRSALAATGEVEEKRIKLLLQRARDDSTLIERLPFAWNPAKSWIENASNLIYGSHPQLSGIISDKTNPPFIQPLDELNLPPTAEERIPGKSTEYLRISDILIKQSTELFFIDPYLNPLTTRYRNTIKAFLFSAAGGRCQSIQFWMRASELFKHGSRGATMTDLKNELRAWSKMVKFRNGAQLQVFAVEDEASREKMHGRYLLSKKGGIRLDQGFQELPQDRKVEVGPIGKHPLSDLLSIYLDGNHDMKVVEHANIVF